MRKYDLGIGSGLLLILWFSYVALTSPRPMEDVSSWALVFWCLIVFLGLLISMVRTWTNPIPKPVSGTHHSWRPRP